MKLLLIIFTCYHVVQRVFSGVVLLRPRSSLLRNVSVENCRFSECVAVIQLLALSAQLCGCHSAVGSVCSVVWLSFSCWLCLLSYVAVI